MDKKILLISGPNLDKLGLRQPEVYGSIALEDYVKTAQKKAASLGVALDHFQSNSEAELINTILNASCNYSAIIINAGALTHYSWSIADALKTFKGPVIELHISNPVSRETFRHTSVIAYASSGSIAGFGILGYELAVEAAFRLLGDVNVN